LGGCGATTATTIAWYRFHAKDGASVQAVAVGEWHPLLRDGWMSFFHMLRYANLF
jgi:hypothetical protein